MSSQVQGRDGSSITRACLLFLLVFTVAAYCFVFLCYAEPFIIASTVKVSYVTALLPFYNDLNRVLVDGFIIEGFLAVMIILLEVYYCRHVPFFRLSLLTTIIILAICIGVSVEIYRLLIVIHPIIHSCSLKLVSNKLYSIAILRRTCLVESLKL